jgi:hypothetical protein
MNSEYSLYEKGELILASDVRGSKAFRTICEERGIPYETGRNWIRERDELGFPKSDTIKLIKDKWSEKESVIVDDLFTIIDKSAKKAIKDIDEASPYQATLMMGIAIDKLNAIRAVSVDEGGSEKFSDMDVASQAEFAERVAVKLRENMLKANAVEVEFEVVE